MTRCSPAKRHPAHACVVDGNLITARFPYDLPRLIKAMVKQLVPAKE